MGGELERRFDWKILRGFQLLLNNLMFPTVCIQHDGICQKYSFKKHVGKYVSLMFEIFLRDGERESSGCCFPVS